MVQTSRAGADPGAAPPRPPGPGAPPAGDRAARRSRRRGGVVPWLFLAPALILFLYFKFIPMAQGLKMSFYEVRTFLGDRYVGGENYRTIVTDRSFVDAMWHTVLLAVGTTAGSILLGLVLALLVEGQARHLWLVRTAAFLPVVTTMAVVAEVWRIMYYPAADGPLNTIIGWLGVAPQPYLADEHSSLASILAVGVWRGAPYDMMIILAGLAGVDRTLYEAAAVDGAATWRRFRHVTMPALGPVFGILFTLAAIRGLRVFTEVFLLTNGAPNGSTEVLMTLIYKLGLQRGELGIAAAGSIVLFAATAVLTVCVRLLRRRESLG
ncbi:sugar ABC transporter permease [Micromonospora sp. NPDC049559]|uniref:carbohydrate ABC transporter permease n=1 Tax=Micromonospora sp. NPDC049559 TaxID=3155923 RepID=UPI003425CB68